MVAQVDIRLQGIEARRLLSQSEGPVNVHNNSTVKSVSKIEGRLSIEFSFSCNFEPGIGFIRIDGTMFLRESEEVMESVLKEWGKGGNNLPATVAERVHNTILTSCITEAVILSKEVGLPAPIPMPTVSLQKKEVKDAKADVDTGSYIR